MTTFDWTERFSGTANLTRKVRDRLLTAARVIKLKKGGAVMLECPERPDPGSAMLHWALTPQQLRLLAPEA